MSECTATNAQGQPCGMQALKGGEYCFAHTPELAEERDAARLKGGKRNRTPHAGDLSIIPARIETPDDVKAILTYALHEVLPAENSIPRARLLRDLASAFLSVVEVSDLEKRIAALEERTK